MIRYKSYWNMIILKALSDSWCWLGVLLCNCLAQKT